MRNQYQGTSYNSAMWFSLQPLAFIPITLALETHIHMHVSAQSVVTRSLKCSESGKERGGGKRFRVSVR
jgi:hypothetical protein